jgi:hypothetical protein
MPLGQRLKWDVPSNPLDLLEEWVSANDWSFDRHSDCELLAEVNGHWCGYQFCVIWQSELSAVFFTCHIDLRIPEKQYPAVCELLVRVNEDLWLGHFDLMAQGQGLIFRHTVPLRGTQGISIEQLEDVVDTATQECEKLYPALQLVVWGGKPVGEALAAAGMETVGEA